MQCPGRPGAEHGSEDVYQVCPTASVVSLLLASGRPEKRFVTSLWPVCLELMTAGSFSKGSLMLKEMGPFLPLGKF